MSARDACWSLRFTALRNNLQSLLQRTARAEGMSGHHVCPLGARAPHGPLCLQDGRATARGAAGGSRAGDLAEERIRGTGRDRIPGCPSKTDFSGTEGPLMGKLTFVPSSGILCDH